MKTCMMIFSLVALCVETIHADSQIGLIGGNTGDNAPYSAFVASDGSLTPLVDLPTKGAIYDVAMNSSGAGIIGGENDSSVSLQPPYAALVAPNGTLIQLSGGGYPSTHNGYIDSVAINNSGAGIIGGQYEMSSMNLAYAALVAPVDGTLTFVFGGTTSPMLGSIEAVSINSSGNSLIGGTNVLSAFAALVNESGTLTPALTGDPLPSNGAIFDVAINDSGLSLIGGQDYSDSGTYAAVISADGTVTSVHPSGSLPASGSIASVAINQSGTGLIGGSDNTNPAYAAFVAPGGALTNIMGLPTNGIIECVAINDAGTGLIGGEINAGASGPAYAAFVYPDGTIKQFAGSLPSTTGAIYSAAINNEGVGLIGGEDFTGIGSAYAALVAPNGALTQLMSADFAGGTASGAINSVAIIGVLSAITPKSIGPYTSAINSVLAGTYALESHLNMQRFKRTSTSSAELAFFEDFQGKKNCSPVVPLKERKFTLWAAPFGDYVHQKAQGKIPSFSNQIGGAIAGLDYHSSNILFGGALAYAYNAIHYGQKMGHGNIQEELACLYLTYTREHLWMNAALWGGLYQFHNKRNSLPNITSRASTHGWVLSPHIEAAIPFHFRSKQYRLEPFAMVDWVNDWQHHYTEKGQSGLNLVVKSWYASLLRSEAGLRFFENFNLKYGDLLLEEKLSYVNMAPFHFHDVNTFFVGSISSFSVATGSSELQNLGSVEIRLRYSPWNQARPYIVLNFQGEFGSSYQSYFGSIELGKNF